MDIVFSFDLQLVAWLLAGAAFVMAIIYVVWQWSRTRKISRFVERTEQQRDYAEEYQPVSIVVDAMNETHQLGEFLPLVLHQDYPEHEVIVVVDSNAEATSDMLSEMKTLFPNLHITFAPYGSRSLSRKKLALMIGIKAAKYDIVLTTNANCRPTNDQWLKLMMRNFTPDTDIVLGYSHYRYKHDKNRGRYMRVFDTVTTGTQWVVSAVEGRPYRGTSDNMAYRKKLFFDARGFASSMDLQWGEDDVFLKEIYKPGNTRLELAPESQMAVDYALFPRTHRLLKMRRDFTSRHVRRAPFIMQGVMSLLCWLRLACIAGVVALSPANAFTWAIAVVLSLLTWIPTLLSFVKNCRLLRAPVLRLSLPLFTLWRPVYNFLYFLRGLRYRKSNYTSFYE